MRSASLESRQISVVAPNVALAKKGEIWQREAPWAWRSVSTYGLLMKNATEYLERKSSRKEAKRNGHDLLGMVNDNVVAPLTRIQPNNLDTRRRVLLLLVLKPRLLE